MKSDTTAVALASTQAVTLWLALAPPLQEVRKSHPGSLDSDTVQDLRTAELVAGGGALAVAAVISATSGDLAPVVVTGAIVAVMVAAYEWTLARTPNHTGETR